MNDQLTPPTPKPPRKRKTSTPRAPRQKDPGILAIEQESSARKANYRKAQKSGGVLTRIREKLLPRLTQADVNRLAEVLNAVATPPLPGITATVERLPHPQ